MQEFFKAGVIYILSMEEEVEKEPSVARFFSEVENWSKYRNSVSIAL